MSDTLSYEEVSKHKVPSELLNAITNDATVNKVKHYPNEDKYKLQFDPEDEIEYHSIKLDKYFIESLYIRERSKSIFLGKGDNND
ncbi:hypothetical protein [Methanohalobium sp.]|uniref:hypothetical protein n=1 Tax=Methanohalobium sp. TaxID=2837493 RepID=UPI0025CCC66A|nr:hypothetical protein [Methanohalobium sp.]